jgi:uracil-DNA glycosylase family 4
MPNYIPGTGDPNAKLAVVGEAGGREEDELSTPFVGPTGKLVDQCLEYAGIDRKNCWLTNVVKYRPPDNDLTRLPEIGVNLEDQIEKLHAELNEINPNCILAYGETALKALTNYKGILSYRGSILPSKIGIKVVPTIHPAALLQSDSSMLPWKNLAFIKEDTKRAVQQSNFPDINRPARYPVIARSSLDLIRFIENNDTPEHKLVVDAETFKTYAQCFGLAFNSHSSICVPTFDNRIEKHELARLWAILHDLFSDSQYKIIAQNSKFDEKRARQLGIPFHDLWFDIPMAWHLLYSEFPKKLAFLTSLLTEEPYYKDEGKEIDPKNIDKWFLYNCKDGYTEFEVYEKVHEMLIEEGLEDFFFNSIMPLHRLYSDLEDTGIKRDNIARDKLSDKYNILRQTKKESLLTKIQLLTPDKTTFSYQTRKKKQKVITTKNITDFNCDSPIQVAAMLYGHLGLPIRKDVGEATLKALSNNAVKDQRKKDIILSVLEDRKLGKTIGTYINFNSSPDGRVRTQVNINGTSSGRTSTSALEPPVSILPEGLALQTMTKHEDTTLDVGGDDLRSQFIADDQFVFLEADYSGAEDHVVCTLAEDWDGLRELNRKDYIYNKQGLKDDRHTKLAMLCMSKDFDNITDYDRQIGKKTCHAGNYDMGKHQGMINFAKYGVYLSEWKVGKLLETFHIVRPFIRSVFHKSVIECLSRNDCKLVNPFGRREQFFERWGDELFKKAYSFIPQSTVSDSLKFAMCRIIRRINNITTGLFYFVQESHDSFLALCHKSIIKIAVKIIREELSRPIDFTKCSIERNHQLIIPIDIKIGRRWVDKSEEFIDGMEKYREDKLINYAY